MKGMTMRLMAAATAAAALAFVPAMGSVQQNVPTCDTVQGIGAVTFSFNEGKTLAPVADPVTGNSNTTGLVVLDSGIMLAESKGSLLKSRDGGCTWTSEATLNYYPVMLTAGGSRRAYAWGDNAPYFARIDERGVHELVVPTDSIHGVGVDPTNGLHVRVGVGNGDILDSIDGGESWMRVGRAPAPTELTLTYRVVFDPQNLDHAVLGRSNDGAWVTFNGGARWLQGQAGVTGQANVFNFAISPVDPNVVWAMGIYLPAVDTPWNGRYIARSTDGGKTFTAVLRQNNRITLRNGPLMVAHPTDPNVLFFVFGTYFANYGTDIYRYNARTGITDIHHNNYPDVNAIAFSKPTPSVMYFGLESHGGGF
jgi:hypothetical protein